MKLTVNFLIVALLVTAGVSAYRVRPVTLMWDYDYTHDSPCTDKVKTNCVRGFNVYLSNLDATPIFVPNRFDAQKRAISRDIGTEAVAPVGSFRFYVSAVGITREGTSIESKRVCQSQVVLPLGLSFHKSDCS